MKVLLIKANYNHKAVPRLPAPLGVLLIGSILEQAGDEVMIYDSRLYWRNRPLPEVLKEFQPDLIGISAISVESFSMHELAAEIRDVMPDTPVIVGGPHPTNYAEEVLADNNIDYAVIHEGDHTILKLRQALLAGEAISAINGVAWRDEDGQIKINPPPTQLTSAELDELPFYNLDLLDLEGYLTSRSSSAVGPCRLMAICSSRGCPYNCTYCNSILGTKYRAQSAERVLDELSRIYEKYGINHFEFTDDAFISDRKRVTALLEGIVTRNLPLKLVFSNGIRTDDLTPDLIDLFAAAGTIYMGVAIETATPRLQRKIKKNLNLDRLAENVEYIAKKRIFSCGFLMLGFPTETYAEAMQTINYTCSLPLHSIQMHLVIPFKGTPMGREVGDVIVDPQKQASYITTTINVSEMTDDQLIWLTRYSYMKFFANPKRAYRILRDHPYPRHIPPLAIIFLRNLLIRFNKKELTSTKDIISRISPSTATTKSRPLAGVPT